MLKNTPRSAKQAFCNKLLSILAISCLGILTYSNTFHAPFELDDRGSVIGNFAIRNISNLNEIWDFWPTRFVSYLSFALNYHFNGLNVFGYHLFNLGVHLISATLVWWLMLLTFACPSMKDDKIAKHAYLISLLIGLVFVAHPLQTEAVTYIFQRVASMATMFYLASLCFYVKSRLLEEKELGKLYYVFSLIMAILAMFTKETAITLPLMILIYEWIFLRMKRNINWRALLPFGIILFIIPFIIILTKSEITQEIHGVIEGAGGMSPYHYFLTQIRVMVTYIRLVFLPINQNLDYDYPVFKGIFELPFIFSLILLITILNFVIRLFSRYRLIAFSIFWFFLTLSPESSFLPFKDVIFEHRLYLPLVGYSIFLVSGLYYFGGEKKIRMMAIALLMVISFYSILTYQRNKIWNDGIALWTDTVQKSPQKARVYNNRGLEYFVQGNFCLAFADFNKAVQINPNFAEGYNNRSVIYSKMGNLIQAISETNKAIELNPNYADAYYNQGNMYYKLNNFSQAMFDYSKAVQINPEFVVAYNNRANTFYQLKEYDNAWNDVHRIEALGVIVNPQFIIELSQVTGKDKY